MVKSTCPPWYSPTQILLANCPNGMGKKYEILNKNQRVKETRREPVSMHPQPIPAIPEETARLARTVLPEGNVFMQMRDEFGTACSLMEPNVASLICCSQRRGNVGGSRPEASSAPRDTRPGCYPHAPSAGMRGRNDAPSAECCWQRLCPRGGFRTWTRRGQNAMRNAGVDFRLPKDEKKRVELAETIGADGRRLLEAVYAESNLSCWAHQPRLAPDP